MASFQEISKKKRNAFYEDGRYPGYINEKGKTLLAAACRLHDATYERIENGEWRPLDGRPLFVDANGYSEDLECVPDMVSFIEARFLMKGQIKRAIRHAKRHSREWSGEYNKRLRIMGRILTEPMFVFD